MKKHIDQTKNVHFEQLKKDGLWYGITDNFIRVATKSDTNLKNKIIPMTLTHLKAEHVYGDVIL